MAPASIRQLKKLLELLGDNPTSEELQSIIENGDLIKDLLEVNLYSVDRDAFARFLLTYRRFFPSVGFQIYQMTKWNKDLGWGFSDAEFEVVQGLQTDLPKSVGLVTPVLVAYQDTVMDTFTNLCDAIGLIHPDAYVWSALFENPGSLKLLPGIEHPGRCLRWEVIDLGAHADETTNLPVREIRNSHSAHAGVIAAAAQFPDWAESMRRDDVPLAFAAGYKAKPAGYDANWIHVPFVGRDAIKLDLGAYSCNDSHPSFAVPEILEIFPAPA